MVDMVYSSKHHEGFTLVELLISVAIIVLLALAGIASYRTFSRRQLLESDIQKLVTALRYTQSSSSVANKLCSAAQDNLVGYKIHISSNGFTINPYCQQMSWNGFGYYSYYERSAVKSGTFAASTVSRYPLPNPITFKTLSEGTDIQEMTGNSFAAIDLTYGSDSKRVVIHDSGQIEETSTTATLPSGNQTYNCTSIHGQDLNGTTCGTGYDFEHPNPVICGGSGCLCKPAAYTCDRIGIAQSFPCNYTCQP